MCWSHLGYVCYSSVMLVTGLLVRGCICYSSIVLVTGLLHACHRSVMYRLQFCYMLVICLLCVGHMSVMCWL